MDKRKKWLLAGCIAVTGVTAVLWLKGYLEVKEPIRVLERNPPGMGDKEIQMEFQTEQGRFPVNLKLASAVIGRMSWKQSLSRDVYGWTMSGSEKMSHPRR